MSEENTGKTNGIANSLDSQGFDWGSGKQQSPATEYIRPVKLPAPPEKNKAKEFLKSGGNKVFDVKPFKRLATIEVRKPKKQEWFRSHPDMITEISVIKKESSGDYFLVHPGIYTDLDDKARENVRDAYLTAAVNDEGGQFLWVILKPTGDGVGGQLFDADLEDLSLSRSKWIRRQWNFGEKSYRVDEASTEKEPAWPENATLTDWIEKGFKNRFIDNVEHLLILRLCGKI